MVNTLGLYLTNVVVSLLTVIVVVYGVLTDNVRQQIVSGKDDVDRMIDYVLNGNGRHAAYNRLAQFGDQFGSRLTGSEALEQAINFTVDELQKEGFHNVHTEPVTAPKWVRGEEHAEMIQPRFQRLPMLGLGSSVGTNGTSIEADIIVVSSFNELLQRGTYNVRDKIVVFNQPWTRYRETVRYRVVGASEAAKMGAVGALVRSLTSYSLATPHTGMQIYAENVTKIPVACITVEDADMLHRMCNRGERVRIRLYMEAINHGTTDTRNVVAEITGSQFPNSVVIVGAHIDSWDVGTGSMDDGGGIMIAWQALSVIKKLRLTPRRTIRLVLWTAEEQGVYGGNQYYTAHKNEVHNISLIIESDYGAFKPKGVRFMGSTDAKLILEETLLLLAAINTTTVLESDISFMGLETISWINTSVPGIELYSANEDYFHYHHTNADTLNVLNADDLDLCTLLWASVIYIVANLDANLPRVGDVTSSAASSVAIGYVDVMTATVAALIVAAKH